MFIWAVTHHVLNGTWCVQGVCYWPGACSTISPFSCHVPGQHVYLRSVRLIYVHVSTFFSSLRVVIVWSDCKWTGNGSGTSVIWTWLNRTESGTRDTPALDCYLLTFWLWTCRIHALNVRWCKIFIRCNISCCLFCGWCEVWFVWNKQKQQSKR